MFRFAVSGGTEAWLGPAIRRGIPRERAEKVVERFIDSMMFWRCMFVYDEIKTDSQCTVR